MKDVETIGEKRSNRMRLVKTEEKTKRKVDVRITAIKKESRLFEEKEGREKYSLE